METKKFVVEVNIPEAKSQIPGIAEIIMTRIKNALFPINNQQPKVYVFGEQPSPVDLFDKCPQCGHPWAKHFDFLDKDGRALSEPVPGRCAECPCFADKLMDLYSHD